MLGRISLAMSFITAACGGSYATQHRDMRVEQPPERAPERSLIASDAQAISDAEIHRILAAQPSLPPRIRVGIVHLRHRSVNDHYGETDPEQMIALSPRFVATLQGSEMVEDAAYLPSFLVSPSATIAQLREAAARYQADLVLLFSTNCRLYPQYNLFTSSEVRAYCSADAAVLDVRTGLVPFVSRSGDDITIKEAKSDYRLSETVQRAELEGIDRAMHLNSEQLVRFLNGVARTPAAPARQTVETAAPAPQ